MSPYLRRLPLSAVNRISPPDMEPPCKDDQTPEERAETAEARLNQQLDRLDDHESYAHN